MNLLTFIADKIIAVLCAVILVLTSITIYQKWQLNSQKTSYVLKFEQLERYAEKLKSEYDSQLNKQNIAATKASNERLKTVLAKQQAISKALNKANEEAKKHEQINKTLTTKLKSSHSKLQQLTQEAASLAKKTSRSSRKCMPSISTSSSNNSTSFEEKLSARIIDATTQMGNEVSEFAEKVSNDYAQLQNECKQLEAWSKLTEY